MTSTRVQGCKSADLFDQISTTARRAAGALVKLRNYLRRTPTPDVARRR